jgi:hypothetical protein
VYEVVAVIAVLTVPVTVLVAGVNEVIEKVTNDVAIPKVDPYPVISIGEFDVVEGVKVAVGVPETIPVFGSKDRPVGSVPAVTEYVTVPVKLEGVSAGVAVIGEFTIPLTVCNAGVNAGAGTTFKTTMRPTSVSQLSEVLVVGEPDSQPIFAQFLKSPPAITLPSLETATAVTILTALTS